MPVGGGHCWFGHSVGRRAGGGAGPVLKPDTMAARVAACTACHGEQGRAGSDGYYPRLAGKPQEYLYHQLLNFRDDRRQYRPMSHLLAGLPDDYLREIAAYFADQHVPYPAAVRPGFPPRSWRPAASLPRMATPRAACRHAPPVMAPRWAGYCRACPACWPAARLHRRPDRQLEERAAARGRARLHGGRGRQADAGGHQRAGGLAVVAAGAASYAAEPADSLKLPAECGSQARR